MRKTGRLRVAGTPRDAVFNDICSLIKLGIKQENESLQIWRRLRK